MNKTSGHVLSDKNMQFEKKATQVYQFHDTNMKSEPLQKNAENSLPYISDQASVYF